MTVRPRVGVLAIQGDVAEHEAALVRAGATSVRVRRPDDLRGLDGLILPGGESTTIGLLAGERGLLVALREFVESGRPTWGTCAGLILLSEDVGLDQPLIGGLDARVKRNAFGRQVDSFETELDIHGLDGGPFRAIFIRAPALERVADDVRILARLRDGTIVAARKGPILVTAFHPELSDDDRLHIDFVEQCRAAMAEESPPRGAPLDALHEDRESFGTSTDNGGRAAGIVAAIATPVPEV